tara:strand:+ start:550 stop:1137 length:588 start_codon:yes stop_codon:yes gene_type:complete
MATFNSPSDSSFKPQIMELIFSTTLTSDTNSVTTGTLPTGYRHLHIVIAAKCDRASEFGCGGGVAARFNGDSSSSYLTLSSRLIANGSAVGPPVNGMSTVTSAVFGSTTGSNISPAPANPNTYSAVVVDILNHEVATRHKAWTSQVTSIGGTVNCSLIALRGGLWQNTDAITSITFVDNQFDMLAGSSFDVYGVK